MTDELGHPLEHPDASHSMNPMTGEVFDLTDPEQAMKVAHECGQVITVLRRLQQRATDALRDEMTGAGVTQVRIGEYEAVEEAGRATYDADGLYQALKELGLTDDALAEYFALKVKDARALGKLERRHDDVAKAVEAHRTRARGRIVVNRKPDPLTAPTLSRERRDRLAEGRAEEREMGELGI